jgi:HK97 family phage prohead protease
MQIETRAYSAFQVRAVDNERRSFSGWATTPATDRYNDVINPLGAKFKNPLVLLHQHDHRSPIGSARFSKPTEKGIEFEAEIPVIDDPGPLKDRVDTAWLELRHGIVRFVSIGFRPIKYAFNDSGGIDYESIEIFELSSVSVPALPSAVVTQVKSMDGRPLSAELIREIKALDTRPGIPLVKSHSIAVPKSGAVRIQKSSP